MAKKISEKILCDERLSHIAFIMDGNGRWARAKGLPRTSGHIAGAAAFKKTVEYCYGISVSGSSAAVSFSGRVGVLSSVKTRNSNKSLTVRKFSGSRKGAALKKRTDRSCPRIFVTNDGKDSADSPCEKF